MKVVLTRKNEAVHFEAVNEDNIKINLDGSPEIGGQNLGVRPMQTLLMGLGGCSGIDVVMILQKQKINPEVFEIEIDAQRDPHNTPSLFTDIHVTFKLGGENLDDKKVLRAVSLSIEKYCSVAKILEATTQLTYSVLVNDIKVK
jgi:putative redox protein